MPLLRFRHSSAAFALVALVLFALGGGCLQATNPFDPSTPQDEQARATLRVRALDADAVVLVAGVTVVVEGAALDRVALDDGDGDGVFVAPALVPGSYSVTVTAAGLGTSARDVTLLAGEERSLDFTLDGGVALGNVTGVARKESQVTADAPDHSGVVVEAFANGVTTGVRTVTNAAGRYDLALVSGTYELHVSAPEHEPQTRDVIVTAGATVTADDVTLEVNPGSISGRVVLEDTIAGDGTSPSPAGATISLVGGAVTATAGDDGTFTVTGLPPGAQQLLVSFADFVATPVNVVVTSSSTHDIGAVTLARARGTITGLVDVAGAADAASVLVEAVGSDVVDVTGVDGAFALRVPTGTYDVTATKTGFRRGRVDSVTVAADALVDVGTLALAPNVGTLSINDDSGLTNNPTVALVIDEPGTVRVRASEDPAFLVNVVDVTAPDDGHVAFTLSAGDGTKTVFAQAIDASGEVTSLTGSIALDTTPPVVDAVSIDDDDGVTDSVSVTVSIVATGADLMRIATDGTLDSEVQSPYAVTSVALLPAGDGAKNVCVEVSDRAGNTVRPDCEAVTLDTTTPSAPLLLRLNTSLIDSTVVNTASGPLLTLIAPFVSASDQDIVAVSAEVISRSGTTPVVDTLELSCRAAGGLVNCDDGGLPGFALPLFEPEAGDERRSNRVLLRARDAAGNVSSASEVLITIDNREPLAPTPTGVNCLAPATAPSGVVTCPAQAYALAHPLNSDSFTLQLKEAPAQVDLSFSHYLVAKTLTTATPAASAFDRSNAVDNLLFALTQGAPLNGVDPQTNPTCTPFQCANSLWIKAVDLAGNEGPVVRIDVVEDSSPPTRPVLTPRGGTLRGTNVSVELSTAAIDRTILGDVDVFAYETKQGTDGAFGGVPDGQPPTGPWVFAIAQNEVNDVCVRGIDDAGNIGLEACVDVSEESLRFPVHTEGSDRRALILGEAIATVVDRDLVVHSLADDDLVNTDDVVRIDDASQAGRLRGVRTLLAAGGERRDLIVDSNDSSFVGTSEFRVYPNVQVDTAQGPRRVCGRGADTDGSTYAFQLNATTIRVATAAAVEAVSVNGGSCSTVAGTDTTVPSLCAGTGVRIAGNVLVWCEGTGTIKRKIGNTVTTLTTAASRATLGIFGNNSDVQQPQVTSTATYWVEGGTLRRAVHAGNTGTNTGVVVGSLEDAEGDRAVFLFLGANGASVDVGFVDTTDVTSFRLITDDLPPQSQASLDGNRVAFVDLGDLDENVGLVDLTRTGWRVASGDDESNVAAGDNMVAYTVIGDSGLAVAAQTETTSPTGVVTRAVRELERVDFANLGTGNFTFVGGTPLGQSTLQAGGKTVFLARDLDPIVNGSQAWRISAVDVSAVDSGAVTVAADAKQIDADPSGDATIAWGVSADGDALVYVDTSTRLQVMRLSGETVSSTVNLGTLSGTIPFVDVEVLDATGLGVAVAQVGNDPIPTTSGDRRRKNIGNLQCARFLNTTVQRAPTSIVNASNAVIRGRAPSVARVGTQLVMTYQADAGTGAPDVLNHACTLTCNAVGTPTCLNDVVFGTRNDGAATVGRLGVAAFITFAQSSAGDVAIYDFNSGKQVVLSGENGDSSGRDFASINGAHVYWADDRLDSFDVWDAVLTP